MSVKKRRILDIPLHENLDPKDFGAIKQPEDFGEIKFFAESKDPMFTSVHGTVRNNRFMGIDKDTNLYDEFSARVDEVNTLRRLCANIKIFIKKNNARLLTLH